MDRIAVIGAGNIGEAFISGLVGAGVDPAKITATNRSESRGAELAQRYGVRTTTNNREAVRDVDVVLLCVKPAQILDVIAQLGEELTVADTCPVLVSMAAGITLASMEEAVSAAGTPIVRVMPNTPMLQGKGVLAAACGRFVDEGQRDDVVKLLSTVGQVFEIAESQMDAVTAISGSGPAYFFLVAEALVDAGVSLGLSRELAEQLACATAAGAGVMLEGEDSPVQLRAKVSSPAGTTVRAIRELEESGIRGAFYRATEICAKRSDELGQ
ncbi:pyrroline-5-carboxylate reductase [Corynebacterium fournieri]|uniref:pyrroline-5-carboxylate reductase n=1 Tax=Corynebacterium fournieri TaxID=1852390 RepID=UPI0025B33D62|nr:pyrroline-5-carboxylate reductase [Corynebacterium fournieri]WJY96661.1 Pyrroline-5-carboxylate reductase [Corynebacterium fournieri]